MAHQKNGFETPYFSTTLRGILKLVADPPETMDTDSLTSEVQQDWRRRKIDRPGKEDRAMGSPPLESTNNSLFSVENRHLRTAGLAGIVCGANVRP
jgi:hypothetical protein